MPTIILPSRHNREPHQVETDPVTGRPIGCTCAAWRTGSVCWAMLQVGASCQDPATRRLCDDLRRKRERRARHTRKQQRAA